MQGILQYADISHAKVAYDFKTKHGAGNQISESFRNMAYSRSGNQATIMKFYLNHVISDHVFRHYYKKQNNWWYTWL